MSTYQCASCKGDVCVMGGDLLHAAKQPLAAGQRW